MDACGAKKSANTVGICLEAKEEEAIEMAFPWLRGKVDTGLHHSTGGAKKSKRA